MQMLQNDDKEIQIHIQDVLCYADNAMIVAEKEDDLQRLLHFFKTTPKKFNMLISVEQTKCIYYNKETSKM